MRVLSKLLKGLGFKHPPQTPGTIPTPHYPNPSDSINNWNKDYDYEYEYEHENECNIHTQVGLARE